MAQYQITVDGEVLHQLFLGDEGVRKLLESVLNQVLEAQVSEHLKAGPYERTDEREGYAWQWLGQGDENPRGHPGASNSSGSQRLILYGLVQQVSAQ
jgi:hypothetical protein